MKILNNLVLSIVVLLLSLIFFIFSLGVFSLSKVSNDDVLKEVVIKPGSIDMIANTLYEENLIRNKFSFKVYVRLTKQTNLKAGTYEFSENMNVNEIVGILENGNSSNPNEISITFKEGINMRTIASIIKENTILFNIFFILFPPFLLYQYYYLYL